MPRTGSRSTSRRRGRPIAADADAQRQRLLTIAAEVFAESGPDATKIQVIAERGGVDRRLIYHYFKSKDDLYIEVLSGIYAKLGVIGGKLAGDAQTVEQLIESLMRQLFAFCRKNPQFVRMLSWENLRDAKGLAKMQSLNIEQTVMDKLAPMVQEEIAAGRCRADLDPRKLFVSALGMCLYVLINRHSLALVVGLDTESNASLDEWIDHAVRQITQGLRP